MPIQEPERWGANVVLRGSFNPLIFQPGWLKDKGLVSSEALEQAVQNETIEIVRPEMVQYKIAKMSIQVRKDVMMVETSEDPIITVSDLVVGCLNELAETPITMCGINYHAHFPSTATEMDKLGDTLAPKGVWKDVFGNEKVSGKVGGLRSIVMREPHDEIGGKYLDVKLEVSDRIKSGVFIHINDHEQLGADEEIHGAGRLVKGLSERYEVTVRRSQQIAKSLMELSQ